MSEEVVPVRKRADIDGGWAWVVMVACYTGALVIGVVTYMGGIINMALLQEYDGDKAKSALIGTLNTGLANTFGPVASIVANIFSCRVSLMLCAVITATAFVSSAFAYSLNTLLVTYGILGGIGFIFGTVYVVAIGYYFEKRRNHMMGFLHTMYGVGMLASSPLSLFLIETWGLRNSLIVMASIMSQLCIVAMLVKPSSIEIELWKKRRKEQKSIMQSVLVSLKSSFQFSVLRNTPFVLFLISSMAWNVLMSVCLVNLPNYMRIKGSNSTQIGVQMFVFGCGNLAGRLLASSIIGSETIDAMLLHIGMLGVGGLVTLTFPFYSNVLGGDIFFAIIAGLYTGGPNTMMTSITVEFVGIANLSAANGLMYFFCGLGYMAAGPIAGFTYGLSGTYDNCFYFAGCFNFVGCFLGMFSVVLRKHGSSSQDEDQNYIPSGCLEIEMKKSRSNLTLNLKDLKTLSQSCGLLEVANYVSDIELNKSYNKERNLAIPKLHKSVDYLPLTRSEMDVDANVEQQYRSANGLNCITSQSKEASDGRNQTLR